MELIGVFVGLVVVALAIVGVVWASQRLARIRLLERQIAELEVRVRQLEMARGPAGGSSG